MIFELCKQQPNDGCCYMIGFLEEYAKETDCHSEAATAKDGASVCLKDKKEKRRRLIKAAGVSPYGGAIICDGTRKTGKIPLETQKGLMLPEKGDPGRRKAPDGSVGKKTGSLNRTQSNNQYPFFLRFRGFGRLFSDRWIPGTLHRPSGQTRARDR